ncbi:hypothetical protein BC939DRAFT_434525 [Gamsiella multidivaricata]|uniref:uncharacterized protein n=1 Tax=Gamsiella multidivaricata TaxID=101098 RepID=UPI0022205D42|nr:uncharacterized protein BC939DRAFT_434525 [Gamsiella multidivaricata]KAG0362922.1 hypothetical protein BGZ54_008423 [Gamsiella multidivaricata]KAI7832834.1 hypothetical protein BC939DRAFT_434525 [Gamsiella multidivaricata]
MEFLRHWREFAFATKPHSSASPGSVRPPKPSLATQIPEILQEIFSYLSQHDLQHRSSGVNRLWRAMSVSLIQGSVLWKDTLALDDQLARLSRLGSAQIKTLYCYAQDKRTFPAFHSGIEQDVDQAWERFQEAITILVENRRGNSFVHNDSSITDELPWRTIVFAGWNCFNQRWDPLIRQCHGFWGVVSLRLEHLTPGVVDLSCIFESLPGLEELVIESSESKPFTYKRNTTITWRTREQQLWKQQRPIHILKLRTLALRRLIVDQTMLEIVLSAMPNLRSLELMHLIANFEFAEASIDRQSLVVFLAKTCPELIHLHFSISGCPMTIPDATQVRGMFSKIQSMSLPARDLQTGTLEIIADRLTNLEIECFGYFYSVELGGLLHDYLCQAPLLLHLKAYRVRLPLEKFILKLPALNGSPSNIYDKPIWACKNLRTLYVTIESISPLPASEETGASRRIFGYISRLCPQLEDIAIERMYLHADIFAGLPLLTRCRRLRRLRICTSLQPFVREHDLEWICLGMIDDKPSRNSVSSSINSGHSSNHGCSMQQNNARYSLLGGFAGALQAVQRMSKGVAGISKSARESRVRALIEDLKRIRTVPHNSVAVSTNSSTIPDVTPAIGSTHSSMCMSTPALRATIERLERKTDDDELEELDPAEMTTLDNVKHVAKQLEKLVQMSANTSRDLNKACCWPRLEKFEIYQMVSLSAPVSQNQELILRLRPDLEPAQRCTSVQ